MYVMYGFVMQINTLVRKRAIQVWVVKVQTMTNRITVQYNKQLFTL